MKEIVVSSDETMSSIELLKIINDARHSNGETTIRRNDFSARVADELDGDHYESFVVDNCNGTKTNVNILVDSTYSYMHNGPCQQGRILW